MLDNLHQIHERDVQDALGRAERQWQQLGYEFSVTTRPTDVANVVCAAVGEAALAVMMTSAWPGQTLPCQVVQDYDVPGYVSEKTLFVAISYSGETQEVLSALEQAEIQGAQIAVITGGGQLAELARQRQYPLVALPPAESSRSGLLYIYQALLALLSGVSLPAGDVAENMEHAAQFLRASVAAWVPVAPLDRNLAKQLAMEFIGKSAVIYAGPDLIPAAHYWKFGFNRNAKQVAWCGQYPAFSHSELPGWTRQPVDKPYAILELRSRFDHVQVQRQFELSERLLSGRRPSPLVIDVPGNDSLEQLLWAVALGDFVSCYTALLSGLNPSSDSFSDKFTEMMETL